jgi:hypothetical protein
VNSDWQEGGGRFRGQRRGAAPEGSVEDWVALRNRGFSQLRRPDKIRFPFCRTGDKMGVVFANPTKVQNHTQNKNIHFVVFFPAGKVD